MALLYQSPCTNPVRATHHLVLTSGGPRGDSRKKRLPTTSNNNSIHDKMQVHQHQGVTGRRQYQRMGCAKTVSAEGFCFTLTNQYAPSHKYTFSKGRLLLGFTRSGCFWTQHRPETTSLHFSVCSCFDLFPTSQCWSKIVPEWSGRVP